jgi:hypothetical protein
MEAFAIVIPHFFVSKADRTIVECRALEAISVEEVSAAAAFGAHCAAPFPVPQRATRGYVTLIMRASLSLWDCRSLLVQSQLQLFSIDESAIGGVGFLSSDYLLRRTDSILEAAYFKENYATAVHRQ